MFQALANMAKLVTADGISACHTAREFLEQLKSHLGTDCHNGVRAAGALISTLVLDGILSEKDGSIFVKTLKRMKLQKYSCPAPYAPVDACREPTLQAILVCGMGRSAIDLIFLHTGFCR